MALTRPQQARVERSTAMVDRLTASTARQWHRARPDDLRSAGMLALVEAAITFDAAHGTEFESYAYKHVRGAVIEAAIKATYDVESTVRAIFRATGPDLEDASSAHLYDRMVSDDARDEAAELLHDLRKHAAALTLTALYPTRSTGGEDELVDRLSERATTKRLRELVEELPERARRVVRAIYEEGASLDQIAAQLGVSKKTVQRDHDEAKAILERGLRRDGVGR